MACPALEPGDPLQRLLALEAQALDLVGVRAHVLVAALQLGLAAVEVGAAAIQRGLQRLGARRAVLELGGPAQKLSVLGRRDRRGGGDGGERRDRPPASVDEGRDDDGGSDERRADQRFHVGCPLPSRRWRRRLVSGAAVWEREARPPGDGGRRFRVLRGPGASEKSTRCGPARAVRTAKSVLGSLGSVALKSVLRWPGS